MINSNFSLVIPISAAAYLLIVYLLLALAQHSYRLSRKWSNRG